jgi:type IV secretory pathway VirB4 component
MKADYFNFLFHWVEWIKPDALGTNAVLSSNINGQYHIGNYVSSDTDGSIFLNPLKTITDTSETSWKTTDIKFAFDERDPSAHLGGSIGKAICYSNIPGPF